MSINLTVHKDNAGVFIKDTEPTKDGLEPNMAINYVSHFVLTESLIPVIMASPRSTYGCRIINTSSASFYAVENLAETEFKSRHWLERFAPYARSKFAQVMYTMELSKRVDSNRVTVNCMEPGMVKTDIYRYDPIAMFFFKGLLSLFAPFLLLTPEEGAVTGVWLALSPDVHAVTGKVFADLHEIPTGLAVDKLFRLQPHHARTVTNTVISKIL